MNYTKNYRLPQWVKEDRIMMDDFNQMNNSIEAGLTSTNSKADAAVSTANAANQTANAAAAARPYVTGTYTGEGVTQTIELGFRPAFLIISGMQSGNMDNSIVDFDRYFCLTAGNVLQPRVKFTDTGFTVLPRTSTAVNPNFTVSGRRYDYIAFK